MGRLIPRARSVSPTSAMQSWRFWTSSIALIACSQFAWLTDSQMIISVPMCFLILRSSIRASCYSQTISRTLTNTKEMVGETQQGNLWLIILTTPIWRITFLDSHRRARTHSHNDNSLEMISAVPLRQRDAQYVMLYSETLLSWLDTQMPTFLEAAAVVKKTK